MADLEKGFNPIVFYDEAHRQISKLHFICGALDDDDPLTYRNSAEGACCVLEDAICALESLVDSLPRDLGGKVGQLQQND